MFAHLFVGPLLSALLSFTSIPSENEIVQKEIDRQVAPYLSNDIVGGLSIGVLANGNRLALGYGRLAGGDARRPTAATVYEIGSISKVFTGILLATAVANEEVRLDQPVQELLPPDVLLVVKDQPILTRHLATHTSGLPRLPNNFSPADPNNPYADYSVNRLYDFLQPYAQKCAKIRRKNVI